MLSRRKFVMELLYSVLGLAIKPLTGFSEENLESKSFSEISEIVTPLEYVEIERFDYNMGFPKVILIEAVHNFKSLERLEKILGMLLTSRDILAAEGFDDNLEMHFENAGAKYGLTKEEIEFLNTKYNTPLIKSHPYFRSLEKIADEKDAPLKGIDNVALSILQMDVRERVEKRVSPEVEYKLYLLYKNLSKDRTSCMDKGLMKLLKEDVNQIYFVTGGIHLGLYSEEKPIIASRLKLRNISYLLLQDKGSIESQKIFK